MNDTASTTAPGDVLETWKNTGEGQIWIKMSRGGDEAESVCIYGGEQFDIYAKERIAHSREARSGDPFNNGILIPLKGYTPPPPPEQPAQPEQATTGPQTMDDIDWSNPEQAVADFAQLQQNQLQQVAANLGVTVAGGTVAPKLSEEELAQIPQGGANPNQLTEEEVDFILTSREDRLVAFKLNTITSVPILQQLLSTAREESITRRQHQLAARITQLDSKAVTLPGMQRVADRDDLVPPPSRVPQDGNGSDDDDSLRLHGSAVMASTPGAGDPEPQPLPPGLAVYDNAAK